MLDAAPVDFVGDTFDDAIEIDLLNDFPVAEIFGTIEHPFDRDWYRFTLPSGAGDTPFLLSVSQFASAGASGSLDSIVSVFNANGMLLASDDDSANGLDATTSVLVLPGETYFVEARGFYVSTGDFRLRLEFVTAADDLPDDLASAFALALSATGVTSHIGRVDSAADLDVLRIEATADGAIAVALNALVNSTLDPALEIRAADNSLLAADDNSGGRGDSFLIFEAVAGQSYFVVIASSSAASPENRIGSYALVVDAAQPGADDFPDTLAEATEILEFNARGAGAWHGALERPRDVDAFRFTALADGDLLVRLARFPGSGLFGRLEVSDTEGEPLAAAEADGVNSNAAELHLAVTAGVSYVIWVSGAGSSFGDYVVSVTRAQVRDDYGDTLSSAYQFNHPTSGSSQIRGEIQFSQDLDVFRFVAASAGDASVTLRTSDASSLGATLQLVDEQGTPLDTIEVPTSDGEQTFSFQALTGQVVYAVVSGLSGVTSDYFLEIATVATLDDDFSDNPAELPRALIELSPTGHGAQSGLIEDTLDADIFEFVAPFDGVLYLRRARAEGSELQSEVRVLDLSTTPAASVVFMGPGDDTALDGSDPTGGFETSFEVTAGVHYLLRVRSQLESVGGYHLSFRGEQSSAPTEDEEGIDFATAVEIALFGEGQGDSAGGVDEVGDEDFYQFTASASGTVLVAQTAAAGSALHNRLTAFDAAFNELADNEGHDGALDALVAFQVSAGETYYLRASAANGLGAYSLSLRTVEGGLQITPLGGPNQGSNLSALDLVMALIGDALDDDAIVIDEGSVEFSGANQAAGIFSGGAGIFGGNDLDALAEGIVLSTGKAVNAIGPNMSRGSSHANDITQVDDRFQPLLDQLTNGKPTFDPAILAFDFVPATT